MDVVCDGNAEQAGEGSEGGGEAEAHFGGKDCWVEIKMVMETEVEIGVGVVVRDVFVWLARDDSLGTSYSQTVSARTSMEYYLVPYLP